MIKATLKPLNLTRLMGAMARPYLGTLPISIWKHDTLMSETNIEGALKRMYWPQQYPFKHKGIVINSHAKYQQLLENNILEAEEAAIHIVFSVSKKSLMEWSKFNDMDISEKCEYLDIQNYVSNRNVVELMDIYFEREKLNR